jgi:predicted hydrocarbon binding protein
VLEPSGYYYPNRIARQFLRAMEDVMGKHGLNTILNMAALDDYIDQPPPDDLARQFDFAYLASLSESLEDMYGTRGGRGIALRIGRSTVNRGLKKFGVLAGMGHPAFHKLPLERRTRLALDALCAVFNRFSDQQNRIEEGDDYYHFIVEVSPMAWGRSAERPVCHALAGIIQETLNWATNGYEFHVHETSCRAVSGDECVFKIHKNPIGGGSLG